MLCRYDALLLQLLLISCALSTACVYGSSIAPRARDREREGTGYQDTQALLC